MFGPDKTLFKPKPSDYFAVGNPAVPQVPAPEPFSIVSHNNPYRSVVNAQTRLLLGGQPIPEPEKPGFSSLLFKALDILDRPRNAVFTGVRHAKDGVGFGAGLASGFTGHEHTSGADFLPQATTTAGKVGRFAGGFLLDVVGDPLTYLTMGSAKLGETALVGGAKAASVGGKLRGALGIAEGAHVTPEMVKGLVGGAEAGITGVEQAVSTASRAATQSRKFFFPGAKAVEPGQLDQLTSFLGKGSIGEVTPEALSKLGSGVSDVTSPAYLSRQEQAALEAAGKRIKPAQQQYIVHSTARKGGIPAEGSNLSASVINSHNTKTFGPYGLVYPMEGSRTRIGGMSMGDGASYIENGVRKFPGGSTKLLPEHLPYGGIGYNEIGYTADKPIGIFIRRGYKGTVDPALKQFAKDNGLPVLRISDKGTMTWKTLDGIDVVDALQPGVKPITRDYPKYLETINKLRERGVLPKTDVSHLPVVDDLLKLNHEQLIKLDIVTAANPGITFQQAMSRVTNDTIKDAVRSNAFNFNRSLFEKLGLSGAVDRAASAKAVFGVSSKHTASFLDATKGMSDFDFLKALKEETDKLLHHVTTGEASDVIHRSGMKSSESGLYGPGAYFAIGKPDTLSAVAGASGKHVISAPSPLKNPFVIRTAEDARNFHKEVDTAFRALGADGDASFRQAHQIVQDKLKSLGHDGIEIHTERAPWALVFDSSKVDVIPKTGGAKAIDAVYRTAYEAMEAKLPGAAAKLDPQQKAIALQLFDLFGGDSGLDVFTAAERIGSNTGVRTGVSKGLEKLGTNLDTLGKAKTSLKDAMTHVELTRGLAADFERETGRYFLKYGGRAIIDITPVKTFAMDKMTELARRVPIVNSIVNTTGMLFGPHYLKWSETAKKVIGPSLQTFEKSLTGMLREEQGLPRLMVQNAMTTLGEEFYKNPKLNEALGYYMEAQMARNMIPDLEKAIAAGTGREIDLLAAQEAIKYWDEIAGTFTPEELAGLKRGHIQYTEKAKDLFQIDEKIGRPYDPVEDYYHHIYKQDDKVVKQHLKSVLTQKERIRASMSTALLGADKDRRFLSMAYAKKLGLTPIDSAVTSLAAREFKTMRARAHHELIENLMKLPGLVSNKAEADFVRLGREIPALSDKFVHSEVARHLKRIDYLFFTDDGYADLMRFISGVTNKVKALQVGYNPNTLMRNIMGEGLMNLVAQISLIAHGYGFNALRGSNEIVKVAEGAIPLQELVQQFQASGGWYAGFMRGNLGESFEELVKAEGEAVSHGRLAPINIVSEKKIGGVALLNPNVIRETSDWFDRWYRLSHYIDRRVKGFGHEAAMEDVRKFHVDYQDLTPSEKHVWRTVVPYYTYFRKNLPIQLRIMMEQPGYQTAIAKLVNNAGHALGDPELSKYATENLALPLYTKDNGDVAVLNWNLPIIDIGRVRTNFRENLQEQLGSLTPLLRVPFELATNRTLSVDRPIEKYQGERVPIFEHTRNSPQIAAKLKYAMEQFGGSAVNVPASTVGRFSDYEQQIPDRPLQVPIFQSLLPVQRPSTAKEAALYRYRDKLLAAIQGAEGRGQTVPALRDWGIK